MTRGIWTSKLERRWLHAFCLLAAFWLIYCPGYVGYKFARNKFLAHHGICSSDDYINLDHFRWMPATMALRLGTYLANPGGIVDARGYGGTTQTISSTYAPASSGSRPITVLFDPATKWVPGANNTDMFAPAPNTILDGLTVDTTGLSGFTGNVVKYVGNTYDFNQLTQLKNFRINALGNTACNAILVQSDDTNYASWITISDGFITGCNYGVYLHSTGSGTGKWVTDIHVGPKVFADDSVIAYNLVADKGNDEGNVFNGVSCQHGTHTTYCMQELNNGGGVFEANRFTDNNYWDTPNAINIGTNVIRTYFNGRFDGTCAGNCGSATNDSSYTTVINQRFCDSSTCNTIGSFGGEFWNVHSGNGLRLNAVDLNKAYIFQVNGSSQMEFDGVSIGVGMIIDPTGAGTVFAGSGAGTFDGANLYNGSGAFIAIPNGVSGARVSQTYHTSGGINQAKRSVAGCATGASAGAVCSTTVTWNTSFADGNYTVTCQGDGVGSGAPVISAITSKAAASVAVNTMAVTAAAAQFSTIECIAVHD